MRNKSKRVVDPLSEAAAVFAHRLFEYGYSHPTTCYCYAAVATPALRRCHVLLPLVAAPSYLLDGVFIGSAATRYMMSTMLVSLLLVYLPLWYFTRDWGNHGLWLAFTAFNGARGITLYYCYRQLNRRDGWLHVI